MQPQEIRNVNNINLNHRFERSLIKKGKIFDYLKQNKNSIGAVELSMELDLSTFYVRQELNKLVEEGLIRIEQAPAQGKLHSCDLVYSYIVEANKCDHQR